MALDPANQFSNLEDAALASLAHESVLRVFTATGTHDIEQVRALIGEACGDDMSQIARAKYFAQRITNWTP